MADRKQRRRSGTAARLFRPSCCRCARQHVNRVAGRCQRRGNAGERKRAGNVRMGRPSEIVLEAEVSGRTVTGLRIGGYAVRVMSGMIELG